MNVFYFYGKAGGRGRKRKRPAVNCQSFMRRKRSNLKQGRPWSARETKRFYKMLKFSGLNFVILEMLYNRAVTKGDDPKKEGAAAAPSDGGSGSGSDGGSDGVSDGDGEGKTSGKRRAPRRRQRKKEKMVHYRDAKAVWYLDVTKGAMLCLHK